MENIIKEIDERCEKLERSRDKLYKIKESIGKGHFSLYLASLLRKELNNPNPDMEEVINKAFIKHLCSFLKEVIILGESLPPNHSDVAKTMMDSMDVLLSKIHISRDILDGEWNGRFEALRSRTGTNSSFYKIIQYDDPDKLVSRLHQLIDGQKGKAVGSVLLKCLQDKLIRRKPSRKEVESEFAIKGSWSGIHKYMDELNDTAKYYASKIKIF